MKKTLEDGTVVEVADGISAEEAEEMAAIEAGFNATDVEPVASEDTTSQKPEEKEEELPADKPEEATAKPLTKEDLDAAIAATRTDMQKINDKVFGKVGELQQKIDAMKGTASGLSAKAKERLKENFPELAEMLFDESDTSAPLETEPKLATAAPAPAATADDPVALEKRLLKRDHPDWEKVVVSDEFTTWKDTVLDAATAAELTGSDDADYVSTKLTEFKEWQKSKGKAVDKEAENRLRLEAGLLPNGQPRSGTSLGDDDEEAAMLAHYKPKR